MFCLARYFINTLQPHLSHPVLQATQKDWLLAHQLLWVDPRLHDKAPLWCNDGVRIDCQAALEGPSVHYRPSLEQ